MAENQLPKGWVESNMDEVFEMAYGKGLKTSNLTEEGFPVYGANGIIGNYTEYHFDEPQVIISCRGAASGAIHTTLPKAFVTSNSIVLKNRINENFNQKFTAYYLKSVDKTEVISGTAQPQITIQNLNKLSFKFPPLAEQQRIVAKLDKLFAHLEETKTRLNKIPQLLKNFRQSVLTQAVTGKLTEDWRKENNISFGSLIELGKVGTWKGGGTPSKSQKEYWENGKVLWVTPKDMKSLIISDSIDKITEESINNSSANYIEKNSILFVTRSGILRRTFPISLLAKEGTVNQDIKALTPGPEFKPLYLLYCLRALEENMRSRCMKSGTTVESVDFTKLKNYQIPKTDLKEQEKVIELVDSLTSKLDDIEERYQNIKSTVDNLPQSILAKAFKGELVEQLPTDGDAQELLDEIKKLKAMPKGRQAQTTKGNQATKKKK